VLSPGKSVNLERALKVGEEIGGHWVQGHVDATARIASIRGIGADVLLAVTLPEHLRRYVAVKGSLALDGVSLTVAELEGPRAILALVPYTLEHTIASNYVEGEDVNLEVDILARYLERLAAASGYLGARGPATAETRSS
jgi:riboflavin synthase